MSNEYDSGLVEKKWQKKWREEGTYLVADNKGDKYYLLVELTYTSGDLHMGHWFAWTGPDVLARFMRMQGKNVLFPVGGFDAFGLPAENAAIKHGVSPREWTYKNIETMRAQFETMGPSFDWDKEVITCDPDYYKWTQFLFLKMYEKGLVYKGKVWSNWCPECKTVVANEHVVNGCCWRHTSTQVEQKEVDQWLVRITDYADRLIWKERPASAGGYGEVNWPKAVVEGQNNWIGRSEGMEIEWEVVGSDRKIKTFTTRPDTLMGVTFIVLSPEHKLVQELDKRKGVSDYLSGALAKTERQRKQDQKVKTGVDTGLRVKHPITGEEIPVWTSDFVLGAYGTGAIMGVPGHDERDRDFAKKYHLDIVKIKPDKSLWDKIAENGWGRRKTSYHLRDWSVSRQRYWGAPVPIIYCKKCGVVPVPEGDLPVILPEKVDYTPTGKPPLATAPNWVKTKCPKCDGEAKRDTETLDTYVDSSWYFFRYPSPKYEKDMFDRKLVGEWMPIKIYFGGPEHILGHTLYARFITKFLYDIGYINFDEFALKRCHHGVMLGPDGYRMSKSRGNVINPDEQVKKFGADAVRVYICFLGPHEKGGTWKLEGIEGTNRFLKKVWRLFNSSSRNVSTLPTAFGLPRSGKRGATTASASFVASNSKLHIKMHQTIKKVTEDIENLSFNTAVSTLMEYTNYLQDALSADRSSLLRGPLRGSQSRSLRSSERFDQDPFEVLVKLLAPFAPHMAEEIYQSKFQSSNDKLQKKFKSVHLEPWPEWDSSKIQEDMIEIAVQVNGKLRATLSVESKISKIEKDVLEMAKSEPNVEKYIGKGSVKKVVFVPGKIINFVV